MIKQKAEISEGMEGRFFYCWHEINLLNLSVVPPTDLKATIIVRIKLAMLNDIVTPYSSLVLMRVIQENSRWLTTT